MPPIPPPAAAPARTAVDHPKTYSALANMRARALDLHARLLELSDAVAMLRDGVGVFANAPWPAFLAKFETLAKLFAQLSDELDRAVVDVGFQNYLLRPRAADELVPAMLRTRLEPEVERDVAELRTEAAAEGEGEGDAAEKIEAMKNRISMFNNFIEGALESFDDERDISLADPRPPEVPPPKSTPEGQALLTALMTGAPV